MQTLDPKVTLGTLVLNSFDLYGKCFTCESVPEMLSSPPVRSSQTPRQGGHGVYDSLSQYGARTLPFEGVLLARTPEERLEMEWALKRYLTLSALQDYATSDGYVLVKIELEDGTLMQCYAKIASAVQFFYREESPGRHMMRGFRFSMVAKDPNLYSQTLKTESGGETYAGTNFQVIQGVSPTVPSQLYSLTPLTATCENLGTSDAPPVITITGPTTSPKVTNVTTGKFIELTGLTLGNGESVTIDVSRGSIELEDGTDVSAYWGSGSDWWVLIPGENEITLLDGNPSLIGATAEISWRDVWL